MRDNQSYIKKDWSYYLFIIIITIIIFCITDINIFFKLSIYFFTYMPLLCKYYLIVLLWIIFVCFMF